MSLKRNLFGFFLVCFCLFFQVDSAITVTSTALSSPTGNETPITISGMTSASTTTNFAFRMVGKTKWQAGIFSPVSYFAISDLRKVAATSDTAGTVTLASFTLGTAELQEIIVMTAVAQNWAISVQSTSSSLENYPISATTTLLDGATFTNMATFLFGDSAGVSGARKASTGEANYGGIIASRIIGINDTASYSSVQCRLQFNASGIIRTVYLGSDLILSDGSRVEGSYRIINTDSRYTFVKNNYKLLSIFGTIELDVISANFYDCQLADGTPVATPQMDYYSIIVQNGNLTTTATAPKSITCPSGCSICDKSNNCLQESNCLYDPDSGQCLTGESCPIAKPFALYNRTTVKHQCFGSLPNQLLLGKLVVSTTNVTIGPLVNPAAYTAADVDQFLFIYSEVGTLVASSKFFFPANMPGNLQFKPKMAAPSSPIIFNFTNYIYNPNRPFAPKHIMALELGPPTTNFSLVVRNLTSLKTNPEGWDALSFPDPTDLQGEEFTATTSFSVISGNYYMVEIFIDSYKSTNMIAAKIPSNQLLFFMNGNLTVYSISSSANGLKPIYCSSGSPCLIHLGFKATSNGKFTIDQSLLPAGSVTPTMRAIKQIVLLSDPYCPSGASVQSNASLCECADSFYANTTTISCLACDSSCSTCNGGTSSNCTSCRSPFILSNNQCVCPSGYISQGGTCVACDSTCLTCSGTTTTCTSCSSPFLVLNNKCACEDGTTRVGSTCQSCDTSCLTCNGVASNNCTSCSSPFVLDSGQCSCQTGFYKKNNGCVACDSSCASCSGATSQECTSCNSPFVLKNGQCVCDTNYFLQGNTCIACDSSCASCSGASSQNCTSCSNPFILEDNQCICSTGFFKQNNTCVACDSSCAACSGDTSQDCTSCSDPFILENNQCVCQTGFFKKGNTCAACDSSCASCSGASSQNCTSCTDPFILEDNQCICETGFGRVGDSCLSCDDSCNTCSGANPYQCTSCSSPFVLEEVKCVCEAGKFKEEDACVDCDSSCATCSGAGPQNCTSCPDLFILKNGLCISRSVDVIESGTDISNWIKLIYLFIFAISLTSSFFYMKKIRSSLKPIRNKVYEAAGTKVNSRSNLNPNEVETTISNFINYSPILFLLNKKLQPREKALRTFHMVTAINFKLFMTVALAKVFNQHADSIDTDGVTDNFAGIILAEICLTSAFMIFYSIVLRPFSKSPLWVMVFFTLGLVGLVIAIEEIVLGKLESIAGIVLISFSLISIILQYFCLDFILASLTNISIIRRLRKLNVYKADDQYKIQVASVDTVPSSINITSVTNVGSETNIGSVTTIGSITNIPSTNNRNTSKSRFFKRLNMGGRWEEANPTPRIDTNPSPNLNHELTQREEKVFQF